jgi:hypothetical protein
MAETVKPVIRKIISKKTYNPCPPIMNRQGEKSVMIDECVSVYDKYVNNCRNR